MYKTVKGLVIKSVKYDDFDRLITVITETEGKLFFRARGISSLKSKNAAACTVYTFSEFVLKQTGEYYSLSRSTPLYYPLRKGCDLQRLSLAGYFVQLLNDTAYDAESSAELLKLAVNALFVISKKDRPADLIKGVFELRLLTALGYAPLIDGCSECGSGIDSGRDFFFDPIEGDILCRECASEGRFLVSRDCLRLIRHSVECDEKSAYALSVTEGLLSEFCAVSERFVLAQLEKKYDTLDFYKEAKELMKDE